MKWMGKTTLAVRLLSEHPKRIILDGAGDFKKGDLLATCLHDFLLFFETGQARPGLNIVYRPARDEKHVRNMVFEFISNLRGWALLIDEADRFCTPSKMPTWLDNLINMSEHYGLAVITTARRAARLHCDITANADRVILFHTHEPNDLKYIEACCGKCAALAVPKLRQRQYIEVEYPPRAENPLTTGR